MYFSIKAELLIKVCSDVETGPVLQDISGEQLSRGSNKAQNVRLGIHALGFRENQRSAFFDVGGLSLYKDLDPQQIYHMHKNKHKRPYSRRVFDIEQETFMPLVF